MDPRAVKGLIVLAALGLYFWFGGVPPTWEEFIKHLSMFLIGSIAIRRPGDLEPTYEDAP